MVSDGTKLHLPALAARAVLAIGLAMAWLQFASLSNHLIKVAVIQGEARVLASFNRPRFSPLLKTLMAVGLVWAMLVLIPMVNYWLD